MKKTILTIFSCTLVLSLAKAQITQPSNQSFESWEAIPGSISNEYYEPTDWNTGNECSEIASLLAVTQSSDAYSGSSSVRLESLDGPGPTIIVNGVLTTAEMICTINGGGQEGGTAYTALIPDSVVGFYKYSPVDNDSAYSQIMFLANNDMDTVSYTRVNFTQTVTEWTRFSAPLTPATGGQNPETLSLLFNSSWGDGSQGDAVIGSVFYIDSVHFVSVPENVNEIYNNPNWTVYPNPAKDVLNVRGLSGQAGHIEILDITGKSVMRAQVGMAGTRIDLNHLVAGVYLYQITTLTNEVVKTGKLMLNP